MPPYDLIHLEYTLLKDVLGVVIVENQMRQPAQFVAMVDKYVQVGDHLNPLELDHIRAVKAQDPNQLPPKSRRCQAMSHIRPR